MDFKYIDLSLLEPLYKDNPDRLKEITKKYADNISELITKLEDALKLSDTNKQKQSAHSLKSAFKYLGLNHQSDIAMQIEQHQTHEINRSSSMLQEIKAYWEKAKNEVEQFTKS